MATLSSTTIARAIYEASKEKSGKELEQVLENSVAVLSSKKMLGKTPQILESLEALLDTKEGIVRAIVSAKKKPGKKEIDEIEGIITKRYKAKEVHLEFIEDEKLLGGIKIEVGDEVIDMTLRSNLKKLQHYLLKS